MKKLLALASLSILTACTSTSAVSSNDPMPTGTDDKARAAVRAILKDPFSVQEFKLGSPHRAVNNFAHPNAWTVCASLYAKNSYGAYTKGLYLVFFKDNQVVDVLGGPQTQPHPECEPMRAASF